ncbi:MAG: RNA polymerase sigma factor [Solirubrobacteraceae bacterium]|jgi:RNA polymerase sigma factor (sigma-70 family)
MREGLSLRCALRRAPAGASDESLLRLAAAGDGEAFAELYRRRLPIVVGFLRRHTATAEVAADLAAETFVAALSYLQSGGALPPSAIAWLLTIARNKLIDSLRRGRVEDAARSRLHLERLELTDEDLEAVERMTAQTQDLPRLLDLLPAEQLSAIKAHVLDERDYDEIAAELQISKAVVRKRVSRGLQRLRMSWSSNSVAR